MIIRQITVFTVWIHMTKQTNKLILKTLNPKKKLDYFNYLLIREHFNMSIM